MIPRRSAPLLLALLLLASQPAWSEPGEVPAEPESSASAATVTEPDADDIEPDLELADEEPVDVPVDVPEATDQAVAEGEEPVLTIPGFGGVEVFHSMVSGSVEGLSQYVDSFFGDERFLDEKTGTFLQVRGSFIVDRYGEVDFDGRVRARVKLPQMEKRVSLVFDSNEDSLLDSDRVTEGGPVIDQINESNPSASLQFVLRERERWDVRLQPGIKVRLPLNPFIKLRLRRTQPMGETWVFRSTSNVAKFSEEGWEFKQSFDFERETGKTGFFRLTPELFWQEKITEDESYVYISQFVFFSHSLSRREQMAYDAGVRFATKPHFRQDSYFASVRYRRNIHKNWLFLELKPQVVFARTDDFKPDGTFVLTLEMMLGGRYMAYNQQKKEGG